MSLLEFRLRIRKRRDELGISADAVRQHLSVSRVYLSSIENGRAILSDAKLDPLLSILELEDQREELGTLLADSRKRGWWQDYASLMDDGFDEFVGLEHGASRVRVIENRVMTGLVQTRPYAEAVMRASPSVKLADMQGLVELRLRRQERLEPPDPLKLRVIMSETVLMQHYGDAATLEQQLTSLLDRLERSESAVDVRIQPFHITPLGATATSTSVLFDYESKHLPTIAWKESSGAVGVVYEPGEVGAEVLNHEEALASTVDRSESIEMLRRRIGELRSS